VSGDERNGLERSPKCAKSMTRTSTSCQRVESPNRFIDQTREKLEPRSFAAATAKERGFGGFSRIDEDADGESPRAPIRLATIHLSKLAP
jgi:hypothetical protein